MTLCISLSQLKRSNPKLFYGISPLSMKCVLSPSEPPFIVGVHHQAPPGTIRRHAGDRLWLVYVLVIRAQLAWHRIEIVVETIQVGSCRLPGFVETAWGRRELNSHE